MSVLLLMSFNGANDQHVFCDDSGMRIFTEPSYQSQRVSTAQKKFGYTSLVVDGTGDYIATSGRLELLNFGEANFSIDLWVYPLTVGLSTIIARELVFIINMNADGTISFRCSQDGVYYTITLTSLTVLSVNRWYHVEVNRVAGSAMWYLFIDGVLEASIQARFNPIAELYRHLTIGCSFNTSNAAPGSYFNGYIDELRITSGETGHTAEFTLPAEPYTLPDITCLLMHFNGSDGSPSIVDDAKRHTVIPMGQVQLDMAQAVFGSSSCYFNGTSDCLVVSGSLEDFFLGHKSWISDLRFRPQAITAANQYLFYKQECFAIYIGTDSKLYMFIQDITTQTASVTLVSVGQWNHAAIAYDEESRRYNLWLNGKLEASIYSESPQARLRTDKNLVVGAGQDGAGNPGSGWFKGWVDEFRFAKRKNPYPLTRQVPSAPFTSTDTYQKLLLHFDGNVNDAMGRHNPTLIGGGTLTWDGTNKMFGTYSYYTNAQTITGNTTPASYIISAVSATDIAKCHVGATISGGSIPSNLGVVTIMSIGVDSITISQQTTATQTAVVFNVGYDNVKVTDNLSDFDLDSGNNVVIDGWIRPSAYPALDSRGYSTSVVIIGRASLWNVNINSSGQVTFLINTAANGQFSIVGSSVSIGQWSHFRAILSGNRMTFWINGKFQGLTWITAGWTMTATTRWLTIGYSVDTNNASPGGYFQGNIEELRFSKGNPTMDWEAAYAIPSAPYDSQNQLVITAEGGVIGGTAHGFRFNPLRGKGGSTAIIGASHNPTLVPKLRMTAIGGAKLAVLDGVRLAPARFQAEGSAIAGGLMALRLNPIRLSSDGGAKLGGAHSFKFGLAEQGDGFASDYSTETDVYGEGESVNTLDGVISVDPVLFGEGVVIPSGIITGFVVESGFDVLCGASEAEFDVEPVMACEAWPVGKADAEFPSETSMMTAGMQIKGAMADRFYTDDFFLAECAVIPDVTGELPSVISMIVISDGVARPATGDMDVDVDMFCTAFRVSGATAFMEVSGV